jgi:DNA-binding NarL/FixJ family response regulator
MKVLIVTDHKMSAQAIEFGLRGTADCEIVGARDGRVPLGATLKDAKPHVILVDDMGNPEDTLARLREVRAMKPPVKAVLLTMKLDPAWQEQVFAAGAAGVVYKKLRALTLGAAIREIHHGTIITRPAGSATAVMPKECPLTERELEIVRLVARGLTNGKIAQELTVTTQTVKFHLSNAYRKLGVANRTEASHYARQHNYLEPPQTVALVTVAAGTVAAVRLAEVA